MTKDRYRLYEGVGVPEMVPGPVSKWADLPLENIEVGDLIELPLKEQEVEKSIKGIRAHVGRIQRRTDKKYSVRTMEYGIGIWRIK